MESITMGNIHEHQLKDPVQEDGPQDPDVAAGVRSYECIFCRRGFTTAQALGGHMNIHRKDRAKNRPSYLSNNYYSNKQEEDNSSNYFYANHPTYYQHPVFATYPQTYNHENNCHGMMIKSSSRDEKMMSLSLQFGWSHEHEEDDDDNESKRRTRGGRNEDDELDLELRLGYDP